MKKECHNVPGFPALGPYSHAVEANGFLFLSGIVPVDPDSGDMEQENVVKATELVLSNLQRMLAHFGLTARHVVKTTIFLRDMEDFHTVNGVYATMFDEEPPARSCVAVKTIPKGLPLEIEAIAVK